VAAAAVTFVTLVVVGRGLGRAVGTLLQQRGSARLAGLVREVWDRIESFASLRDADIVLSSDVSSNVALEPVRLVQYPVAEAAGN